MSSNTNRSHPSRSSLSTWPTSNEMAPYNTRVATRQRALTPYENVIVIPSATGKGTHIRWVYPTETEALTRTRPPIRLNPGHPTQGENVVAVVPPPPLQGKGHTSDGSTD